MDEPAYDSLKAQTSAEMVWVCLLVGQSLYSQILLLELGTRNKQLSLRGRIQDNTFVIYILLTCKKNMYSVYVTENKEGNFNLFACHTAFLFSYFSLRNREK